MLKALRKSTSHIPLLLTERTDGGSLHAVYALHNHRAIGAGGRSLHLCHDGRANALRQPLAKLLRNRERVRRYRGSDHILCTVCTLAGGRLGPLRRWRM